MNLRRTLPACVFVLLAGALAPAAAPQVDLGDNAALIYWQAIAVMPEVKDAEQEAVDDWSPQANEARADLVKASEAAVRLMRQASAKERADWGIDMSPGPHTLLPHLQRVRQLSRIALAAATEKMHEQQPQEAAEIAMAVMRMARHVEPARTFIEMLVQIAVETQAERWVARHAPQMTPQVRGYVLEQLDRLPPGATTASSMEGEKLFLVWARREFKVDRVKTLQDLGGEVQALEAVDLETLFKWLDEVDRWYEQVVAAVQRPYPEPADAVAELMKKIEASDNVLAKLVFPSVERVWIVEQASRARMELLRAGLRKLNGAEQVMRDPYGDGPFKIIEHDGGFTLESKLQMDSRPIELVFGNPMQK